MLPPPVGPSSAPSRFGAAEIPIAAGAKPPATAKEYLPANETAAAVVDERGDRKLAVFTVDLQMANPRSLRNLYSSD
jgi:hypothetical protein